MTAMQGVPVRNISKLERIVINALSDAGSPLSPLELTRWVERNPDAAAACPIIVNAAEALWLIGLASKSTDGNYSIKGISPAPAITTAVIRRKFVEKFIEGNGQ